MDTPGLNESDQNDDKHILNIVSCISRLKNLSLICIVNSSMAPFSESFRRMLSIFKQTLPGFLNGSIAIIHTFWDNDIIDILSREERADRINSFKLCLKSTQSNIDLINFDNIHHFFLNNVCTDAFLNPRIEGLKTMMLEDSISSLMTLVAAQTIDIPTHSLSIVKTERMKLFEKLHISPLEFVGSAFIDGLLLMESGKPENKHICGAGKDIIEKFQENCELFSRLSEIKRTLECIALTSHIIVDSKVTEPCYMILGKEPLFIETIPSNVSISSFSWDETNKSVIPKDNVTNMKLSAKNTRWLNGAVISYLNVHEKFSNEIEILEKELNDIHEKMLISNQAIEKILQFNSLGDESDALVLSLINGTEENYRIFDSGSLNDESKQYTKLNAIQKIYIRFRRNYDLLSRTKSECSLPHFLALQEAIEFEDNNKESINWSKVLDSYYHAYDKYSSSLDY